MTRDFAPVIERVRACFDGAFEPRRLFHGRGRCYPDYTDVVVDWFPPYIIVGAFGEDLGGEASCNRLLDALAGLPGVEGVLLQQRQGRTTHAEVARGDVPEQFTVSENGLRFVIRPHRNQNIGLFLDMATIRQWLRDHAQGARILNMFAYTCSFSVYGLAGGADLVVNNDMSRSALDWGRENHELNDAGGVDAAKARYLPYNLLKSWRKIRQLGPFDISIIDPPTNQRGSFVAENDYAQILKRLPTFMRRGGRVVMCLNSPYLPYRFLQEQMARRCPECRFEERLFPSGDFEEVDADHALKVAVFRYG